jgi:hypothetical protein
MLQLLLILRKESPLLVPHRPTKLTIKQSHLTLLAVIYWLFSTSLPLLAQSPARLIMQSYNDLSSQVSLSLAPNRVFSPEQLLTLAKAHYLLGEYDLAKSTLTPLLRNATLKNEATLLQLYIAIAQNDPRLANLINAAKTLPYSHLDNLHTANAKEWLQAQATSTLAPWQHLADNASALEDLRTSRPPFEPSRILIERQLIHLYTQSKNIPALDALANQASLAADKEAARYNQALLLAPSNPNLAKKLLQQVANSPYAAYRSKANTDLLLLAISSNDTESQQALAKALATDLPANDLYLLLAQLQLNNQDNRQSLASASKWIKHKDFAQLPLSLRRYGYQSQAYAKLRLGDLNGALADYRTVAQLQDSRVSSFESQYALLLLEDNVGNLPAASTIRNLAGHNPSPHQARLSHWLEIYYSYVRGGIEPMERLLASTSPDWRTDAGFYLLEALQLRYQQQYEATALAYHQASTKLTLPSLQAQALMLSATHYVDAGMMSKANYQLGQLLALNDNYLTYLDVKFTLAQVMLSQNQTQTALELFAESFSLSQKPPRQVTILTAMPNQKEIALQYYSALQANAPMQASQLLETLGIKQHELANEIASHHAQSLFNSGSYKEAAPLLEAHVVQAAASTAPDILYQAALAYELSTQLGKAKELYIQHLNSYANQRHSIAIARRLASLASYQELNNLLFGSSPAPFVSDMRLQPVLALAWVQKSSQAAQRRTYSWLDSADFSKAPLTEVLQRNRLLAQFYQRNQASEQALYYWQELANLTQSRADHQEARQARSAIFESTQNLPSAVQELITLANTLGPWPAESQQALQQAYDLCVRHNLTRQAQVIQNRIVSEFHKT